MGDLKIKEYNGRYVNLHSNASQKPFYEWLIVTHKKGETIFVNAKELKYIKLNVKKRVKKDERFYFYALCYKNQYCT